MSVLLNLTVIEQKRYEIVEYFIVSIFQGICRYYCTVLYIPCDLGLKESYFDEESTDSFGHRKIL
jgi:hypothetical protein